MHDTLNAVPHYGIGYGLLRYLYAPTARLLGAARPADIFFSYVGTIPDLPSVSSDDAPVQFDADTAMPVREAIPGLGSRRGASGVSLGWCAAPGLVVRHAAGSRRPRRRSLADGFSTALMDLVRQAIAEDESDSAIDELTLVDLS